MSATGRMTTSRVQSMVPPGSGCRWTAILPGGPARAESSATGRGPGEIGCGRRRQALVADPRFDACPVLGPQPLHEVERQRCRPAEAVGAEALAAERVEVLVVTVPGDQPQAAQ